MKNPSNVPSAGRMRHCTLSATLLLSLSAAALMAVGGAAHAAPARLHTADDFAILAGSTITNSGVSTVVGDVGLHPGTAVTGFESCTGPANCVVLTGSQHVDDGVAAQAKADLLTGYDQLVGLHSTCTSLGVELGGRTTPLTPGVYCSPTFGLTGTLTLDGAGEYVFLTGAGGSTLTTAAGSEVLLINGADACDVYWQVASSATIGAASAFAGNILAQTSISFDAGATLEGSALALDAAVTLINNTITNSGCASDGGGTTPGDDGTTTTAPGTTPGTTGTGTTTPATTTGTGTTTPATTTGTATTTPATTSTFRSDSPTAGPPTGGTPGGTTSQVTRVPSGSVSAGGGGVHDGSGYDALLAAAGVVAMGCAWRRRHAI